MPLRLWVDAQLPPVLAEQLRGAFDVEATHVFDLGLVGARDEAIYARARAADAIVVTKDSDFVRLLEAHGPPPQVLWVTVGNVRNAELWLAIKSAWPRAALHFAAGEPLVEIQRGA